MKMNTIEDITKEINPEKKLKLRMAINIEIMLADRMDRAILANSSKVSLACLMSRLSFSRMA